VRKISSAIAKVLPPIHVTERITPWLTLLAAGVAAYWAIFQYQDQLDIQRVATTLDLHRQYRMQFPEGVSELFQNPRQKEGVVSEIVGVQCRYLAEISSGPQLPDPCGATGTIDPAAMTLRMSDLTASERLALSDEIEKAIALRDDLQPDGSKVEAMMAFNLSISVCVDQGTCDADTVTALFLREIILFLNNTCVALHRDAVLTADSRNLANFIRRIRGQSPPYWSVDPKQQQPFFCSYLR